MFYAMRCGTAEEDVDVLNFTCKLAPDGAGYDDGDDNGGLPAVGGSARKKRKAYEELQEASKKRTEDLKDLTKSVMEYISSTSRGTSGDQNLGCVSSDTSAALMQRLHVLTKERAELQKLDTTDELTKVSLSLIEKQLMKVQRECQKLLDN